MKSDRMSDFSGPGRARQAPIRQLTPNRPRSPIHNYCQYPVQARAVAREGDAARVVPVSVVLVAVAGYRVRIRPAHS
jgi:hypothetical protein